MGLIITPQVEIDKYFASPAINQSTLKELQGGLDSLMISIAKRNKQEEENGPTPDYFLIGGAVDCILTGEEGVFEDKYYVSQLDKKPTEVEMKIVDYVFVLAEAEGSLNLNFEDCEEWILEAANAMEWQMRWKAETRVAKLIEAGVAYFEDKKRAFGKEIISADMYDNIQNIVTSLKTNFRTAKYFNREEQAEIENIDFYYQLPMYFTYRGIECKALMDLVIVFKDSSGNIVKIQPIDLKTMNGNTLQFISKIRMHRYDIQASWYSYALCEYFDIPVTNRDEILQPFQFIVESTTNIGTPLVFELTHSSLYHGANGSPAGTFKASDSDRTLFYPAQKGWKQLITEYVHYQKQGFHTDIQIFNRTIR